MDVYETEQSLPADYRLDRSLGLLCMGQRDPSFRLNQHAAHMAFHAEEGPVVVAACVDAGRLTVTVRGPDADALAARVAPLFGLHDRPDAFVPSGKLGRLVAAQHGTYLPCVPWVFPRLVQIVLLQLVTWQEGFRSWHQIVRRHGQPVRCGEETLLCPPSARQIAGLGYYDLVACGALPRQARLILHLAKENARLEASRGDVDQLVERLQRIPGIGPWTLGYLLGGGLGQPDALLLGDYHMPHTVAWFLAGEERATDDRMLELLAPYTGHRFRVVHHLWQSGVMPPRRGPKRGLRSFSPSRYRSGSS